MRRKDWVETDGTVKAVYVEQQVEGQSYSVVFTYVVDGHYYGGSFTPLSSPPAVGETLTIRYDPDNPEMNEMVIRERILKWVIGFATAIIVVAFIVALFLRK